MTIVWLIHSTVDGQVRWQSPETRAMLDVLGWSKLFWKIGSNFNFLG